MLRIIAASILASILLSASASRADEPPAPPPAPEPSAAPAGPPPVVAPPPPDYAPPSYVPCQPTWANPCKPPSRPPPPLVLPPVLKWHEGEPIPPGYHRGTESRAEFIIAGAVTFGAAWVPSAIMGSFGLFTLAIPLVGPFITPPMWESGRPSGALTFLFILDGVQQAGGIVMLIAGHAAQRTVLRRDRIKAAKAWWLPAPMSFGKGSAGLGIVGTM